MFSLHMYLVQHQIMQLAELNPAGFVLIFESFSERGDYLRHKAFLQLFSQRSLAFLYYLYAVFHPACEFLLELQFQSLKVLLGSQLHSSLGLIHAGLMFSRFCLYLLHFAQDVGADVLVAVIRFGVQQLLVLFYLLVDLADAQGQGVDFRPVLLHNADKFSETIELVGRLQQNLEFAVLVEQSRNVGLEHIDFGCEGFIIYLLRDPEHINEYDIIQTGIVAQIKEPYSIVFRGCE